jgi:FAD/FMN-containing dehydrogenase
MISGRESVAGSVALLVSSSASGGLALGPEPILVNDIHSQLNSTRVLEILQPRTLEDVQNMVRAARKDRKVISVAGGRHAMGGQQFAVDPLLIDIRKLSRVLNLHRKRGIIEVEAVIEWPELIESYLALQPGDRDSWEIAQKQTGADRLTMAGTIAANAHGRGLKMKPFISDVESFVLVDASGAAHTCSRTENPDLFWAGSWRIRSLWNRHLRTVAPRAEKEGRADRGNSDGGDPDGCV